MVLPRPPKAVIFDMDGLLVDSEVIYAEALGAQAIAMGRNLPLEVIKRMIGHTWPGSAAVLRQHFGPDFDDQALKDGAVARFHEIARAGVALKAGVLEFLDHLDVLRLPRALCTSSRRAAVDLHFAEHGLAARFDAVLAHGDYLRPKPDPEPYLKAAQALGVDPADCLALEDSHNGVRAAAGAGMMTVMVPDMLDPTEEMESLCVRIARDLHEVRGWLS